MEKENIHISSIYKRWDEIKNYSYFLNQVYTKNDEYNVFPQSIYYIYPYRSGPESFLSATVIYASSKSFCNITYLPFLIASMPAS